MDSCAKKAEIEAEVVDLCSSDEEMEDVSRVSTTVKQEEEEGDDEDEDDSDDDAEYTGESSEDSSDDEFGIAGLKQIYEEHFGGDEEQQMDTTKETKGAEELKRTSKVGSTSKSMIKLKKSEKPMVVTEIQPYEPPMMRRRASIMPEKTLGECLLEQFEKLEAEELQEAKEIAEMARMIPKPKARGKPKKTPPVRMSKIPDPEHMETGDIEGPASGQITPGEASVISDMYTADMSMEINLRNMLLEPKKWKLNNLDEIYSMLELQRIRKNIPDGYLQKSDFRARVAERVGQFQTTRVLMKQKKQRELEQEKCKAQKNSTIKKKFNVNVWKFNKFLMLCENLNNK